MRQVGKLSTESEATRFRDALLVAGMRSTLDKGDGEWSIWIHEEDDLEPAKALLQQFRDDPQAPPFQSASEQADAVRDAEIAKWRDARKKQVNVRETWDRRASQGTPLTWLLVALSITVSIVTEFGGAQPQILGKLWIDTPDFARMVGTGRPLIPNDIRNGEVWRLFTPILLHLSPLHLIFNMIWTYQLGREIELRAGTLKFFLLVMLAAACSNWGQYLVDGPMFGGMSGVVYALFGFVWIRSQYTTASNYFMDGQVVFWMLAWFAACFSGLLGNIANTAHAVGLVIGVLAALPQVLLEKTR